MERDKSVLFSRFEILIWKALLKKQQRNLTSTFNFAQLLSKVVFPGRLNEWTDKEQNLLHASACHLQANCQMSIATACQSPDWVKLWITFQKVPNIDCHMSNAACFCMLVVRYSQILTVSWQTVPNIAKHSESAVVQSVLMATKKLFRVNGDPAVQGVGLDNPQASSSTILWFATVQRQQYHPPTDKMVLQCGGH